MPENKSIYLQALRNEIFSQKLYTMLAKSFKRKPEISEIFTRLYRMEKGHEESIRALFKKNFPGSEPEVEAKAPESVGKLDITNPGDVLEFAITRETIAADVYHKMASLSTSEEACKFMEGMAAEEDKHREILEEEILRLDGLLTWFDPSELNGLVEY